MQIYATSLQIFANLTTVADNSIKKNAIQCLQYAINTSSASLCFTKHNGYQGLQLEAYVDASFRENFTAGVYIFLNGNLIDWQAKVFKIAVDSSCLAEAHGLKLGANKVQFITNILDSLHLPYSKPIFYSDNNVLEHFLLKNGSTKNIRSWPFRWHTLKTSFNRRTQS